MDVFVWKSYGDVDVYGIATVEQLRQVIEQVRSEIVDWDHTNDLCIFIDTTLNARRSIPQLRGLLNYTLEEIGVGSHEMFEWGTGIVELK